MRPPPRVFRWLIGLVCDPEDRSYIRSDLEEELEDRRASDGELRARMWYRSQVLRSLVPCLSRRVGRTLASGGWLADPGGADLRYAARRLAGTPAQVLVTVTSLGIGIGLVTAVFAVANAFMLRAPSGLSDTEGLVALYTSRENGSPYGPTSYPDFEDVSGEEDVFSGATAARPGVVRWDDGDAARRIVIEIVTGSYFDVLGVPVPLGRGFLPEETVVGRAQPVVVVSHEFWQNELGADPSALGRALRLDGRDFTVVGVAPEGLLGRFLRLRVDAWVPLGLPGGIYHQTDEELEDRRDREYVSFARLAPGVTLAQAQARVDVLASRLHAEHDQAWTDDRGAPLRLTVLDDVEAGIPPDGRAAMAGTVAFLLVGAGLILLVACINVAGLFLARAMRRRREIAIRLSLGAGRARLVRLLLTEALLLALLGGLVGVWLAGLFTGLLGAIPIPLDVPLSFGVGMDGRVLGFALGTSVLACVVFGLVPAVQAVRVDLAAMMKGGEEGDVAAGRVRLRSVLVTVQVAASAALLLGAGLFLRSTDALASLDTGLDVQGVAVASWTHRDESLPEEEARHHVLDALRRVAAHPDVASAALASVPEASLWADGSVARLEVDGYLPGADESMLVAFSAVTPGYLEMMDRRTVRGRAIETGDVQGSPPVAVVNEAFARRFWPGEPALGRRFRVTEKRTFSSPYPSTLHGFEVVGILPDVRPSPDSDPEPYFWTSYLQDYSRLVVVHARGRTGAGAVVPVLSKELQAGTDQIPLVPARTYEELVAFNRLPHRLASLAFGYAGGFALLLALIGIYSIVSFAVCRRSREMAIRTALGAGWDQVVVTVVAGGMRLVALGVALGVAVAVPGAFLARSWLFGVSPLDPMALVGSLGPLLTAAAVATLVPALRATRVEPMKILRDD